MDLSIESSCTNLFNDTLLQAPLTPLDPPETLQIAKAPKPSLEWNDMPTELRLLFLEKIAWLTKVYPPPRKGSLPTVCSEWRDFFERRNFRSLRVKDFDDLIQLNLLVNGRREAFVKYIVLFVDLGTYDCRHCDQAEGDAEKAWNNIVFGRTLLLLFEVLSTWNLVDQKPKNNGLTLVLGAASRSDVQHNYATFGGIERAAVDREPQHLIHSQSRHFSREGCKKRTLGSLLDFDIGSGEMVFDDPTNDKECVKVPQVRMVRRFLIDRRYYRSLSAQALDLILRRLPCLVEIKYVYWCGIDREEQKPWTTLQFLALTSHSTMRPDASPLLANQLLVAAANAALHMPKLETMELWKSWREYGTFAFRYAVLDRATILDVGAAWPFDLEQDARDAWDLVAFSNTRHRLSKRFIDSAALTSGHSLSKTIRMLGY
ncbi:uncharacterized protein ColSpa_12513 [Colletotrichum spaethianum]|uniref:DUF6546 domain-containing protein n=1 Tax=Colletotrichum spaethianum TaxID=700344 RepID=A0AA37PHP2_9PEZI|nr:uncharacterized protein ColSpa_12513 [Colletotrichum spaethianum]GKT52332.1 hypothetical protein ColSpa_12513 [Colletotrichum spaethianum]